MTRISSPLARVLVAFFLSLCALCFLGSYVISAKAIRDRIRTQGGDLIHATVYPANGTRIVLPNAEQTLRLLGAESVALRSIGNVRTDSRKMLPVFTYDFCRSGQFLPLMAPGGGPTLLCREGDPAYSPGPLDVTIQGETTARTIMVRTLPKDHLLLRMMPHGVVLVQPDTPGITDRPDSVQHLLLRVRDLQEAGDLKRTENYLKTFLRLEGQQGVIASASSLMEEMDVILGNQTQCRAGFCLGIIAIVGILLTALAGMEYRQNEYIYTLMKSFGIHPLLLVAGFLAENLVLVGLSFWAAVEVFMHSQHIIVSQFFKMGQYSLTREEIMPEIRLIAAALLLCIAVSALPILVAANREIGKVLK